MKRNPVVRFICTALVFVTVFATVPFFAAEADAAGSAPILSVFYDFEDGTLGTALTADYLSKTAGLSAQDEPSRINFFEDPKDSDNIVVGRTNDNGNFKIKDDNESLLESLFSIEMDLYVADLPVAVSNSGDPLALFTWNDGKNLPLVRLGGDGALYLTNKNNSSSDPTNADNYTRTNAVLSEGNWYNIRLDVNAVNDFATLYVNGKLIITNEMPNVTESKYIRIFQPNG